MNIYRVKFKIRYLEFIYIQGELSGKFPIGHRGRSIKNKNAHKLANI